MLYLFTYVLYLSQARRMCYRFSTGLTPAGKAFDVFVGTLIILNVVAVVVESEPTVGDKYQTFFDLFEVRFISSRFFWCY